MRTLLIASILTFVLLAGSIAGADGQNTQFFGLQPPGDTPEIFAPGVVSSSDQVEQGCAIAPDGKEFYFVRAAPTGPDVAIWVVREENGKLSNPKVVSFSGVYRDFNPFITSDGKRMIFFRQSFNEAKAKQGSWVAERNGDTWGEPRFLVEDYTVTTSDFRTFYFTSERRETTSKDMGSTSSSRPRGTSGGSAAMSFLD